jgi:hypothetical protein
MAHRLPPELFQRILLRLTDEAFLDDGEQQPCLGKRGLGSCSLVCRYWVQCRRVLFRYLYLRTREDALTFIDFVKADTGAYNIGYYVAQLTLEQSTSECTWVHVVALMVKSRPWPSGRRPDMKLVVRGNPAKMDSSAQAYYSYHTIFGDLPRSLPPSCIQTNSMTLSNLHFKDVQEMLLCLRSIPRRCLRLACRALSLEDGWSFTPSDLALNLRLSSPMWLSEISILDCSLHWPFVLLVLRSTPRNKRVAEYSGGVYVHELELGHVLSAVESVAGAFDLLGRTDYSGARIVKEYLSNSPTNHLEMLISLQRR